MMYGLLAFASLGKYPHPNSDLSVTDCHPSSSSTLFFTNITSAAEVQPKNIADSSGIKVSLIIFLRMSSVCTKLFNDVNFKNTVVSIF